MEGADWVAWCDGSAVPNPGRMGLGAVLIAPDGTRHALSQATHTIGCNNEAELRALMAAAGEARARGATTLQVYSDNSVVVAQLRDASAEPIARLAPLFDEARMLLNGFDRVAVAWVPRHRNREADVLARKALGMAPKAVTKPWKRR
ncbi:MAG: ribonuclease HI family protein [Variovorax sp.]|nr:MAG: ribonuclease HI family protein [Variovorax sp.]